MPGRIATFLDTIAERRILRRWAAAQGQVPDLSALKALRGRARHVRREADRLLHLAEGRLAAAGHSNALPQALHSDWAWRPEAWRGPLRPSGLAAVGTRTGFGAEATVFHDCKTSELSLRQVRTRRDTDRAAYGLQMEVLGFDGSFLSLVIDLPEGAVQRITQRHLVRLDAVIVAESPIEMFARLNVKHGPNTEQLVREMPRGSQDVVVEFDLAYAKFNEKRVERAWVDLIFDRPAMNRIDLRDVSFSRRLRADL